MPTKKPIIQTVVEESVYNKFKEICKKNDRTESKMTAIIIKQYIDQYEEKNGEIFTSGGGYSSSGEG